MKRFAWNEEKNEWLKENRGISFDDVVEAVIQDRALAVIKHENQAKYPGQKQLIVAISNYAYAVPFVIQKDKSWFLKTVYPNRKYTKKYLNLRKE